MSLGMVVGVSKYTDNMFAVALSDVRVTLGVQWSAFNAQSIATDCSCPHRALSLLYSTAVAACRQTCSCTSDIPAHSATICNASSTHKRSISRECCCCCLLLLSTCTEAQTALASEIQSAKHK